MPVRKNAAAQKCGIHAAFSIQPIILEMKRMLRDKHGAKVGDGGGGGWGILWESGMVTKSDQCYTSRGQQAQPGLPRFSIWESVEEAAKAQPLCLLPLLALCILSQHASHYCSCA